MISAINHTVEKIVVNDSRIGGVIANGKFFELDDLIVSTGGLSYPSTGSTGDGYRLLKEVGHSITELKPCEVSLTCDDRDILSRSLMGLSLKDKLVEVVVNGKTTAAARGDLIFTHFGLSGPVILKLSEQALETEGSMVRINHEIGDFDGFREVRERIDVPKRYWDYIVRDLEQKPLEQISKKDRAMLGKKLGYQSFRISGSLGIDKAVITSGGVSCREFDRRTLESTLVGGLYVCGEVLDVHGSVGGYNLTLALSSGHLAGSSIV